jgi:uncharacterized damage-inducible protein DinB
LRTARSDEDTRIEDFAASVTDAFLAGTVQYENNEGRIFDDPADMLVSHFFNHQTHHRGQVHDMLCQTDVRPPVLDLHRVLKPNPDS